MDYFDVYYCFFFQNEKRAANNFKENIFLKNENQ